MVVTLGLSLTLKDGHRLRTFENRVLRRIFGPKKEEMAGGWRRLHSEELHNLYASNIIRVIKSGMIRMVGCVARMVYKRNTRTYKNFDRKTGRIETTWNM
jgi:hypothetical protein